MRTDYLESSDAHECQRSSMTLQVAIRLCREVGIEGMSDGATAFVRRLRERREAILHALEQFEPAAGHAPKGDRVVSADEMCAAHANRQRDTSPVGLVPRPQLGADRQRCLPLGRPRRAAHFSAGT